jgi:hypothetical protein
MHCIVVIPMLIGNESHQVFEKPAHIDAVVCR